MYATLKMARDALETAADQMLEDYRTWVADDVAAKPRYGQIPAYDAVNAAVRECEDALCAAPTVARQQCGQSGGLAAFREALELPRWYSDAELLSAIRAYLTSATPPDVAILADTLEAIEIVRIRANIDALGIKPIEAANRAIRQAATALRLSAGGGVPEGWKLVPVEPTPEMIGAFWRQKNCGTQGVGERGPQTDDYSAYRAMLAASPTVEAGHVE